MNGTFRSRAVVAAAFATLMTVGSWTAVSAGNPEKGSSLLDGKNFRIEMREPGATEADADQLVFRAGTFRSTGCDPYGFRAVPYNATRAKADRIEFQAEATSAAEGRMVWKGTVAGDSIEGTAHWHKEGQPTVEYTFRGRLEG